MISVFYRFGEVAVKSVLQTHEKRKIEYNNNIIAFSEILKKEIRSADQRLKKKSNVWSFKIV